jgi:hypothetical protein
VNVQSMGTTVGERLELHWIAPIAIWLFSVSVASIAIQNHDWFRLSPVLRAVALLTPGVNLAVAIVGMIRAPRPNVQPEESGSSGYTII